MDSPGKPEDLHKPVGLWPCHGQGGNQVNATTTQKRGEGYHATKPNFIAEIRCSKTRVSKRLQALYDSVVTKQYLLINFEKYDITTILSYFLLTISTYIRLNNIQISNL